MRNLSQFFSYLHDIEFPYVVLRNWENLPDRVEYGHHSDLDLLVYDLDHFKEVFSPVMSPEYPLPRVRHRLEMDVGDIYLDARHVGDGYYPQDFEHDIIKTRQWNTSGFFTPNPYLHRVALGYHAVHHKGENTYQKYLGDVSVKSLLDAFKKSKIGWSSPDDPTVGKFHAYQSGATSVVSRENGYVTKIQTQFKERDLIANEARFLKVLNSRHFPKLISTDGDTIKIEESGAELTKENMPENWKLQLTRILIELKNKNIVHRDIRVDNILVKDSVVKLIDFGWARFATEPDGDVPDLLGYPNKPSWGFDDNYSMKRVIKQIEWQLEESLIKCAS